MSIVQKTVVTNMLVWLIAPIIIAVIRNVNFSSQIVELISAVLGYLLLGLLSGFVLGRMRATVRDKWENGFFFGGYLFALPFAFALSVMVPVVWGLPSESSIPLFVFNFVIYPLSIGISGAIPMILGGWVGKLLGRFLTSDSTPQ